jgi:lipopolysaccharide biosynthesis glycosyltransferase
MSVLNCNRYSIYIFVMQLMDSFIHKPSMH